MDQLKSAFPIKTWWFFQPGMSVCRTGWFKMVRKIGGNSNCKEAVLCSCLTNNLFLVYVVSTHLNKYARQIGCFSWRIGVKMTNIFELPPPSNPPLPDIMVTIKTTRWKDRLKPRKWTRWRCLGRHGLKGGWRFEVWDIFVGSTDCHRGGDGMAGFGGAPFPSESVESIWCHTRSLKLRYLGFFSPSNKQCSQRLLHSGH